MNAVLRFITMAALAALLAACGGGEECDEAGEWVWVRLDNGQRTQCPRDPLTFVGPLPLECFRVGPR